MLTRIAVLVSGGGTNLQALMDAEKAGAIPHGEICLVISNRPDAYALTRAQNGGVPALVVPGGAEETVLALLTQYRIDLVVLAGYLVILEGAVLARYENRILNVHPSLIPAFSGRGYYGLRVHEAALKRGVKVTGATVHLVNEIPDGGKILLQKAVEVLEGDTPERLQLRVMEQAEWVLLPKACELLCEKLQRGEAL